ncbi:hypothetical protein D3C73_1010660 [compost metagenome]
MSRVQRMIAVGSELLPIQLARVDHRVHSRGTVHGRDAVMFRHLLMHRDVERLIAGQVFVSRCIHEAQLRIRRQPPALADNPLHTAYGFLPVLPVIDTEFDKQQVGRTFAKHMLLQPVRPERRSGPADSGIDAADRMARVYTLQILSGQRAPTGCTGIRSACPLCNGAA